jgi:hypothetical protein
MCIRCAWRPTEPDLRLAESPQLITFPLLKFTTHVKRTNGDSLPDKEAVAVWVGVGLEDDLAYELYVERLTRPDARCAEECADG